MFSYSKMAKFCWCVVLNSCPSLCCEIYMHVLFSNLYLYQLKTFTNMVWCLFAMEEEEEEGNVYLTTHSTHFIYSYMASNIW